MILLEQTNLNDFTTSIPYSLKNPNNIKEYSYTYVKQINILF